MKRTTDDPRCYCRSLPRAVQNVCRYCQEAGERRKIEPRSSDSIQDASEPGPCETLARLAMQSERYRDDEEFRLAVDAVIGHPVYDAAPELVEAVRGLAWALPCREDLVEHYGESQAAACWEHFIRGRDILDRVVGS